MNEIWYLTIALFLSLSFFVISTITPPQTNNIKRVYELNGTVYGCKKGLVFNKEKLICEIENIQ